MQRNHQRTHPEAPDDELAEELHEDGEDQLKPMETRASNVSEADWVEQQRSAPVDDDERED